MIFIDFETRSKCVIQDTGAWRYAEDPSTDVLCMAYAIDDQPVEIWYPGEPFPFEDILIADDEKFEAHHSFFERAIWRNIMKVRYGWPDIPDHMWACSAALACYHALPRALDQLGAALNLAHQKDNFGKRIMMKLSRPKTPVKGDEICDKWCDNNEDFKALYQYCKADVEAERAVHKRLRALPASEAAIWALDQKINERGIRVDMPAVRAAIRLLEAQETRQKAEFKALTGIESPTMVAALKAWLKTKGVTVDGLTKNDVIMALEQTQNSDPAIRRALELRQALSRTSTAKYQAIADSVCGDDRLRGLLMYHGASTGRWTGQLVQPQNLAKNTFKGDLDGFFDFMKSADSEMFEMVYPVADTLSKTIRGVFIPAEGHVFVGGDYNAIEARVLFWLASETNGLQMFRENADIYKDLAATIYNKPAANVTPAERDLGKRGILGCGYGMGAVKFKQTCMDFARVDISEELAERVISTYRSKYRTVAVLWQLQEVAAKQAIETQKPVRCGKVLWAVHDGFLFCRLPSGRNLAYYDPKVEPVETSWGEMKASVTFMGLNSVTKQWERTSTYGGKIVENLCQAVARDVMAHAMLNCEAAGFKVVLTVHDELLTEADIRDRHIVQYGESRESELKKRFEKIMTNLPAWAVGLPVRAEAWTGRRYAK